MSKFIKNKNKISSPIQLKSRNQVFKNSSLFYAFPQISCCSKKYANVDNCMYFHNTEFAIKKNIKPSKRNPANGRTVHLNMHVIFS